MSFLPLILIALLLFRKTDSPILEFLKNMDIETVSPILELLGLNQDSLGFLNDENFKNFLSGSGDLKSLIPMLLPLIKNFTTPKTTTADFSEDLKSQYLSPIKDIASSEITDILDGYFSLK